MTLSTGEQLRRMGEECPDHLNVIKPLLNVDDDRNRRVTICGGLYTERDDGVMPLESQFWNLRKGQRVTEEVLGKPADVFARMSSANHPQLPSILQQEGLRRAVIWAFDGAVVPTDGIE